MAADFTKIFKQLGMVALVHRQGLRAQKSHRVAMWLRRPGGLHRRGAYAPLRGLQLLSRLGLCAMVQRIITSLMPSTDIFTSERVCRHVKPDNFAVDVSIFLSPCQLPGAAAAAACLLVPLVLPAGAGWCRFPLLPAVSCCVLLLPAARTFRVWRH